MAEQEPERREPEPRDYTPQQAHYGLMARRRQRIVDEIQRNRRGDYVVPTWVLTAALLALIAGIAAIVIFS
ncbi:MAG TPA: hypothetical protein VHA75_03065 [Rugosimonospora sp.]|nr:hypothetical protein [Rugosimonospora sp.]